jgi:hypothetical protein
MYAIIKSWVDWTPLYERFGHLFNLAETKIRKVAERLRGFRWGGGGWGGLGVAEAAEGVGGGDVRRMPVFTS